MTKHLLEYRGHTNEQRMYLHESHTAGLFPAVSAPGRVFLLNNHSSSRNAPTLSFLICQSPLELVSERQPQPVEWFEHGMFLQATVLEGPELVILLGKFRTLKGVGLLEGVGNKPGPMSCVLSASWWQCDQLAPLSCHHAFPTMASLPCPSLAGKPQLLK